MAVDASRMSVFAGPAVRTEERLPFTPTHVGLAAVAAAVLAGALMARDVGMGAAVVGAAVFLPAVALNLQFGIAMWITLLWGEYSQVFGPGPFLTTLIVIVAWVGAYRSRALQRIGGARPRPETAAIVLLLAWVTVSVAWADDRGMAQAAVREWLIAAAAFVVVSTSIQSPRHARIVCGGFVAGALVSLLIGLSGQGVTTTASAIDTATQSRFAGGVGDPNVLCAGLAPAFALTLALAAWLRDPLLKLGAALVALAIIAGMAATQSRGGLIAVVVMIVAAIVLMRGRRLQVLSFAALGLTVAGIALSMQPGAIDRITGFDGGGNGRSELWGVAWRMAQDHPVTGVGIDNFTVHSPDYVQRPGGLEYVELIADEPLVTHSVYLQQLAEAGVVGLGLMLAFFAGSIAAGVVAARRFERLGDRASAGLATAVAIGSIGMLTASAFISDATDKRLWILLALGPGLLGAARRAERAHRTAPS